MELVRTGAVGGRTKSPGRLPCIGLLHVLDLWAYLEAWGCDSPVPRVRVQDASPRLKLGERGFCTTLQKLSTRPLELHTVNRAHSCQRNLSGRRRESRWIRQAARKVAMLGPCAQIMRAKGEQIPSVDERWPLT